jgi:hypothetical protein
VSVIPTLPRITHSMILFHHALNDVVVRLDDLLQKEEVPLIGVRDAKGRLPAVVHQHLSLATRCAGVRIRYDTGPARPLAGAPGRGGLQRPQRDPADKAPQRGLGLRRANKPHGTRTFSAYVASGKLKPG